MQIVCLRIWRIEILQSLQKSTIWNTAWCAYSSSGRVSRYRPTETEDYLSFFVLKPGVKTVIIQKTVASCESLFNVYGVLW